MKAQDPTLRRTHLIILLLIAALLMTTLAPGAALAKKDMQVATEGDPGDGNLSPESLQASSGSGSCMSGGMSTFDDGVIQNGWTLSLPGLPILIPGQATWFFMPRTMEDHARWNGMPISLQRERRCGHAR